MKTKPKLPTQPLDHFKKARLAYFQGVVRLADVKKEKERE